MLFIIEQVLSPIIIQLIFSKGGKNVQWKKTVFVETRVNKVKFYIKSNSPF